ncbi:Peroxin-3 [Basidiobolus meristosporus CBS 931.73]|uniref:Peroxin-3 n=1 Tax=Basidiobolus meristosporus CBS 931.73 TaxID=1314790 RepID=A0A1Y1XRE4_9FUNG|nr:Peroxin-3 [Basidiobolus meristosporus CBS 931.73]|eukprot:ORX88320.1 Peroxin-3 [Basidiobolus meristosporus CBS 931.73]
MFQSIANFGRRHRRGFIITAGIIGGFYALGQYAKRKIVELQEKATRENIAKENLRRRFEQNQRDCLMTVLSLLPTLGEQMISEVNVEGSLAKLQQKRGVRAANEASDAQEQAMDRKTKLQLWEELKITSFTQTIASIYLTVLLNIFVHIQLNLLGRFIYIDSVLSFSEKDREKSFRLEPSNDERRRLSREVERKFLTFSWWLLHVGWKRCVDNVKSAVEEVLGQTSLKKSFDFNDTVKTIQDIRNRIEFEGDPTELSENRTPTNMRDLLLPDDLEGELQVLKEGSGIDDPQMDDELRMLLDEVKDFLDSPDFVVVRQSCLDEAFSFLSYNMRSTFVLKGADTRPSPKLYELDSAEDPIADQTTERAVPLVSLLPVISRQVHHIINGVPNNYVEILCSVKELQSYSAIVYSSFNLED